MRMGNRVDAKRGFTIIELLTIISIIGILGAIMIPKLYSAIDKARLTGCKENLRNIATALQTYANDYEGDYPDSLDKIAPSYIGLVPSCPAAAKDTYSASYIVNATHTLFTVCCKGDNHKVMELDSDQPYFDLTEGLGPKK
jgi:type II secretory pathway pseudopilin PulG